MPWPVKSTLMVSREREPVTGSTRTRRQRAGITLGRVTTALDRLGQYQATSPTEEAGQMRIVIALGGNALLRRGEPMATEAQRRTIKAILVATLG